MRFNLLSIKTACFVSMLALGAPLAASHGAVMTDFEDWQASSEWNAFILGDVTDYSLSGEDQTDIEGSVAISGNLQGSGGAIPSLTIGAGLAAQPGFDASQTTLVVGGDLFNRNNMINGSVWVGGSADLGGGPEFGGGFSVTGNLSVGGDLVFNGSNSGGQIGEDIGAGARTLVGGTVDMGRGSNVFGTLQGNSTITVHGTGMGSTDEIIAAGLFTHDNPDPYLNGIATSGAPVVSIPGSPVDFVAMTSGLQSESLEMAALSANADWQINDLSRTGTILNAADSTAGPGEIIVFDLGSDPSAIWNNGFFIDADEDASIIINIGGASHTVTNFAFDYSPILSLENVIFNFYEASEIFLGDAFDLSGIGFLGNIFAPLATVTFFNGQLNGNLVAAGLTGDGQINRVHDRAVPEPGTLILLLLGLCLIAGPRVLKMKRV
jgi:choice-of-anchor A domain-containing protein